MYLMGQRKKCISFFLVGILVVVTLAGAVLSAPVCVYALSLGGLQGTIASLIISLMLQAGVAPVNQTWINQINTSYGVESSIGTIGDCIENGLLTEAGGELLDTGLSNAIQNADAYDLIDDIFTTTATDVGVEAASGAVNIANTAINVGKVGKIGLFAGAVAVGVGVGVIANHLREKFTNYVKYGIPISANNFLAQNVSGYDGSMYYTDIVFSNNMREYITRYNFTSDNLVAGTYNIGSSTYYDIYKIDTNESVSYNYSYYNTSTGYLENRQYNMGSVVSHSNSSTDLVKGHNFKTFPSKQDFQQYVADVRAGIAEVPPVYSPDLIGTDGNLTFDSTNQDVPNINNIVPQGYDMTPVDMTDYQDYVDQANDNTSNEDVGEDVQGQELTDFIQPYLQPDETQVGPSIPDDPVGPEQPDFPVKPTPAPEEITDVLILTPDENLKDKFPFCIPFDIYDFITGLVAEREAPVITCPVDLSGNTITVDLSEFDEVAALLRLLELILFIVGLAVSTRKLIGATGGG